MKTHPETRALWQTEIRRAVKYLPPSKRKAIQKSLFDTRYAFETARAANKSNLSFWAASTRALWSTFAESYNALSKGVPDRRQILLGRALRRYIAALETLSDNSEGIPKRDIPILTRGLYQSFGLEE